MSVNNSRLSDFALRVDATITQTALATGDSRLKVRRKISEGRYRSYLDGGVRKIIVQSVLDDRKRMIEEDAKSPMQPGPGRGHKGPRKPKIAAAQKAIAAPVEPEQIGESRKRAGRKVEGRLAP
jgi:hypothetical protein